MSGRNRSWSRSPPSPPSPIDWEEDAQRWEDEYDDQPWVDQDELQRQWLEENRNPDFSVVANPDFIFESPNEAPRIQTVGIAYHVHDVFDNIRENAYLITDTLGGPHTDLILFKIGIEEFLNGFYGICSQILHRHYSSPIYERELDKVSQIINKLDRARNEFLSEENISSMFTWIQFVLRQPDVFQKFYIDVFIEDTFNAYNGNKDTISCPKGIVERVLFSIADACILYCVSFKKPRKNKNKQKNKNKTSKTVGGGKHNTTMKGGKWKSMYRTCDNPIYRKLIRLFKKEVPDLNSLSQEWAIILEDTNEMAKMSAEDLKANFIEFMTRKYKLFGLTQTDQINKRAIQYEEAHIFENKGFS